MKVAMIGTGYVGLVSGTCFADRGHHVMCIDIDQKKIDILKQGESPIYEPRLSDLLKKNIKDNRIFFSTKYDFVKEAKVVFLAVGTPSSPSGEANLEYLKEAAISTAKHIQDETIIVIKSTVPVGTSTMIRKLLSENTDKKFYLVNNPEFLKEGAAIDDFMKPDRVVIGFKEPHAGEVMEELYAPLLRQGNPLYKMSNLSAELTKYASNCFLATKISFINEIARLCDILGADIEEVRKGMMADKRIGNQFFYPGLGYGGSCFPKDVKALISTAKENDYNLKIVQAAEEVNKEQKTYLIPKILEHFKGDLKDKTIALWGIAFKPNTDDIREAPAKDMAKAIIKAGGKVNYFDPIASDNFIKETKDIKEYQGCTNFKNKYDCLNNADALILITEWPEFHAPDFDEIKNRLKAPVIFDGRNIFKGDRVRSYGIEYFSIGKQD